MKRTWFWVGAVLGLSALVPLALATTMIVDEARLDGRAATRECASYPLVPFPAGLVRIAGSQAVAEITNEGPASSARACVLDARGVKRIDLTLTFTARERREVPLELPPGSYSLQTEAGGGRAVATLSAGWCLSGSDSVQARFDASPGRRMIGATSGPCLPGAFAVGLVGLTASGGAFVAHTRLVKPRLLDAAIRRRVYDLVAREPGIHSRQLVRSLGAAEGQTAYHLDVLAREKMLVSVGLPGFRHWFLTGRFTPNQMRAIAVLRDPTRRRLYDAVVATPGASLSAISEAAAVSVPQGSRAARILERAGLIERQAAGRALLLRPRQHPSDVFAAEHEAALD